MKYFLLLGVLLLSLFGFAQEDIFPEDDAGFIREFTAYLDRVDKKTTKSLMEDFSPIWLGTTFSSAEKKRIIDLCNQMAIYKMRPYPEMSDYIEGLILYGNTPALKKHFSSWHTMLEALAVKKETKRDLADLHSFVRYFFRDKVLHQTRSKSVNWFTDNLDFEFSMKSGSPRVTFEKLNLKCEAKGDSMVIYNTKGELYPLDESWEGESGLVDWSRAGFSKELMQAKLSSYSIALRKPNYTADSVVFENKKYFEDPLIGRLEDKILADVKLERVSYPRFNSYNKRLLIKNIAKGVDFDGGFAQHGREFLGSGTRENPSKLIFYRESKPFLIAQSNQFVISLKSDEEVEESKKDKDERVKERDKSRIISKEAYVVMALDTDTIVHPGLNFKFFIDDRELNLIRTGEGMSKATYENNYHNISMDFELMSWKLDEPIIEFKSLEMSSSQQADFRSLAYYTENEFMNLMGTRSKHPLSELKHCAENFFSDELPLEEVARCLSLPITQVEPMMFRYSYDGYVGYNKETQTVTIKEKLRHYVGAKSKINDYDVLQVISNASASTNMVNATLNLLNYELTMKGVRRVVLSPQHRVAIYPKGQQIVMSKDRDIDFSGLLSAGKLEYFGSNFKFDYEHFIIDMPIIDSLQIWADTEQKDKQGYTLEARVKTVLENLNGELVIDVPNNKSGRYDIAKFPVFTSERESYAYYDRKEILGKVYDRDKFYYQVNPFELDSLDKFTNDQINFEGTFVSAGIFPDIEEPLRLQEDYSLGFKVQTPPGGLEAYGGKGTFENKVQLSHKGLIGDGNINYITSTSNSEAFYFFPDSVNGYTRSFDIEEQMAAVEYPTVTAKEVYVHWEPYEDHLYAATLPEKETFNMYAGVAAHTGELDYSPTGLVGRGINEFEGARLTSNRMDFKFYEFFADTADFVLSTDTMFNTIDFSTYQINAHIDFKERVAKCKSNGEPTLTVFDVVQYQAYLDRFTWYMDSEEVEFSAEGGETNSGADAVELEGAKFTSINAKQDSLSWYAKAATYNLTGKTITAKEVEQVDVADARIIPVDGRLFVRKGADIEPLEDAKVIANRKLKYHQMYVANVDILGKWKYTGSGLYDYVDENNRKQTLTLDRIGVDTTRQTYAEGSIADSMSFTLSPAFGFEGDFRIEASRKDLEFDGYGSLNHTCEMMPPARFSFKSVVDPRDIVITINDPVNAERDALNSGVILPVDSSLLYSTFLSKKESKRDESMIDATGYLVFDKGSKEYRIASLEKLNQRSFPGAYVSLNTGSCMLEGEGKLLLAKKTGLVDVMPVGRVKHNTITNEVSIEGALLLNFLFDSKASDIIRKAILSYEGLEATTLDRPIYELALREYIGVEEAEELIGKISLGKNFKTPDELEKTFFINDVNLKWSKKEELFYSEGPIGIGNMGKDEVNRYVDGRLLIENGRSGAEINLLIELDSRTWFVFNFKYSTGYMRIYSSVEAFNTAIQDVKGDDRKMKGERGTKPYIFIKGTKRQRDDIIKKFEDL